MTLFVLTSNEAPVGHAAQAAPASADKLRKAAQEFEAILLESWLEKMNQSFVGSADSQDPAHDTVSSLGTQAIAEALAARGGIGIATMLLNQVGLPSASKQPSGQATWRPRKE